MASECSNINVFKVRNGIKPSDLDCESLKEILNEENIGSIVVECDDGWLIKIDCFSLDVLAKKEYELFGKFHDKPYYLDFENTSLPFPEEEEELQSLNKDCTGTVESKILVTNIPSNTTQRDLINYFENDLPYGGKVQYSRIESNNATICFFDVEVANIVTSKAPLFFNGKWLKVYKDSFESKMPVNKVDTKVDTKTICVHNVPEDMDMENLEVFFENRRTSGGGKIEKKPTRDPHTNLVEITFATEEIAKCVVGKSPLTYNNCTLQVTLKQPLKTDDLAGKKIQKLPPQSDPRTIVVYNVPKTLSPDEVKLYFENPKSARGGQITDFDFDRKNGIKITFASSIVARNVVEKKNHMIDKNPLTVSMYIPPAMEEKQVLISDIRHQISADTMKNFLEVKVDLEVEDVKNIKPGIWLVYFADKIDFEKVKTVCKSESKDYLSQTYPKVRQIPITNKIIVSNFSAQMNQELLKNFFYNPLEPNALVSTKMLPGRRCIMTFKDANLASAMSRLKRTEFDINLYNDYINGNETYTDIPLPSPFWMKFIMDQKKVFEDELKDCGNPVWSESNSNSLKIMCNGDIKEEEIKKSVEALLATVHEEQLVIPSIIFEEVKEMIQNDTDAIQIYFDNQNFTAHIFSFNKSIAADYKKKMLNIVESKSNTTVEETLDPYKISLLFADLFPSKIYPKYNKLKITTDGTKLVLYGFSSDINMVMIDIYRFISTICTSSVQLSRNAHHILKVKSVKEYLQKKLKSKKYICAWEINSDEQVLIHSSQKNNLQFAIDILKKSIVDLTFPLTDPMKKIIKEEKWNKFLLNLSNKYGNQYYIEVQEEKLSIVTTDQEATKIGDDFETFFETYVTYKSTFPLKYGIYNFLKTFKKNSINKFCQNHESTINFENDQTIHISGSRKANKEASDFLQTLINGIKEKKEIFSHFGFKRFLQTETAGIMLEKISKSHKCIILNNAEINSNNILQKEVSDYQVNYANSKIILQFGDITELEVDAIVNAANKELKHIGGVAQAIVKKGGQQIQDECDTHMANKGCISLPEGSIKVTTAGKLKCKLIIHAVGPIWQDGKNYETQSLSEAITNSLTVAEKENCNSIAFPAISTGIFRFPLDKATGVIVLNIKEYLDNNPNTSLKSIYLVSIRKNVISAFHQQLKSMFPEVTAPQKESDDISKEVKAELPAESLQLLHESSTSTPIQSQLLYETSTSTPIVQTKIEIVPGLLNKTKCNVIVNTTNNSLELTSGAISKAILADAGPGLQEECYKHPGLATYDIAVTGGYNLPCDKVFHISLPHWSQSSPDPHLGVWKSVLHFASDQSVNSQSNLCLYKLRVPAKNFSSHKIAEEATSLQNWLLRFHRVCPFSHTMPSAYSTKILTCLHLHNNIIIKGCVKNCLLKADEMNCSHIAFPAFGTGNLGYPIDIVANAMFSAALKYISDEKTVLQKISFVIYPKDKIILQAFEHVKTVGPTISEAQTYQPDIRKDTATSNVFPQDNNVSFDIKGINLTVVTGSITEQSVGGIVHGTNQQFTLNGAISKALLQRIGHQFTQDCKSKVAEMTLNNYAVTNAHSLAATNIVHVNIEGITKNASEIFKLCFDAAEKHQITSLALPPLGTGGLGCSIQYFTKHFLSALQNFAKSSPQNLKTVKLVIFQKEMFTEVCREMSSTEKTQPYGFSQIASTIMSTISSAFSIGKKEVFLPKKLPSASCLFFYAESLDTVKEVKKVIDSKYTSEYFSCKDIQVRIIEEMPDEQKQIINRLQYEHEVKIEFKYSKITVSGYKEDVSIAIENIQSLLLSLTINLADTKTAEITQKLVQWSYMTSKNGEPTLVSYPTDINHQLEQAYGHQKILKLHLDYKVVVFDFNNPDEMCEYTENDQKNSIKIFRRDKTKGISVPEFWASMENKDYLKVELTSGTEYDKVKNAFPRNFSIVKIERIQNKSLYKQYQAQLEKMNLTNPKGTQNETQGLWHGTSEDVTEKINKTGFNRSYCGKNATAYGQGVYFAVEAAYSLSQTYSPSNASGHKHIYMCNVLTGMFCKGNSTIKVPPENHKVPGIPYDSTVNDVNKPSIYVIFHDANAYPAYLITCK